MAAGTRQRVCPGFPPRSALLRAVNDDDLEEVIRKLLEQAKKGDVASAKVLLERLFGKPFQQLHLTADDSVVDPGEEFV